MSTACLLVVFVFVLVTRITILPLFSQSTMSFEPQKYKAPPELMKELTWGGKLEQGALCGPILDFLGEFINENQEYMKELKQKKKKCNFEVVKQRLRRYVAVREAEKQELMKALNVNKLVIPCIELDVPLLVLREYHMRRTPGFGCELFFNSVLGTIKWVKMIPECCSTAMIFSLGSICVSLVVC